MHYKMSVFWKGELVHLFLVSREKSRGNRTITCLKRIVLLVVSALLQLNCWCVFVEGDGLDWNGLKQKLIVPVLTSLLLVAMVTWGQAVFSFHSSNATPAGNEAILTRPRKTAWCRRVDKVGPCLRLMIWLCFFSLQNECCFIVPSGWN